MQQRLFRFFVIAILPWVILLAVVANLWFLDSSQSSNSSAFFMNSSAVSFGIQAIVGLAATLVVLVSQVLAKVTVRPFETLILLQQTPNVVWTLSARLPQMFLIN